MMKIRTIDPMEETKASVETISNLAKQLQALSSKLSEVSRELDNVKTISQSLQKHSDICKKNLTLLNSKTKEIETSGCFRDNEINNNCIRAYTFDMIKATIKLAWKNKGLPYGGIVRDLFIPYYEFKMDLKSIDFKDIDLWFKNEEDSRKFIEYLYGIMDKLSDENKDGGEHGYSLYSSEIPSHHTTEKTKYKFYPGVKRDVYVIRYSGLSNRHKVTDFLYIDVVISDTFPVNDMSANLMVMMDDFGKFGIGQDKDDQYKRYTYEDLLQQIGSKQMELLSGYRNLIPFKVLKNIVPVLYSITPPPKNYNDPTIPYDKILCNDKSFETMIIVKRICKFLLSGWNVS